MSAVHTPEAYMVTLNGVPLKRGLRKEEADAMAERWQGSHSGNKGLLKHKDRGDWVEVKRDYAFERETKERIDEAMRGNPQRFVIQHEA